MISATYKKAAIGISILMFATSAGYTFNPVEVKADDEKPAMNVEYHSKQDIVDYYNKHPFDGDMDTKYKEEPDVFAPYNLGSLTQKTIDNAQNMVNVVRYVAGLSGMTVEDASLSKSAQAAALANAANGELSHYPRRPRDMSDNMYNLAQEGASSSNIAMTSGRMTLPMSIRMYLSDADSGNRSRVGHRRWILYPTLYKIGFGQVEGYTATRVIGGERNYSAKEYGVAWPAQNTPVELLSYSGNSSVNLYPWSISFGQAPGSDINVTLINNQTGYSWHFGNDYADGEFYVNNGGYGQKGCVIFYPEYLHMSKGDSYTVQINNIGISGYQDTLTYNVNIFSLKDKDLSDDSDNITCIFDTIIDKIEPPTCDMDGTMQMLVSNIDYDDYLGRIAIGRIERGKIKNGMPVSICKQEKNTQGKIAKLFTYMGLKRVEVDEVDAGDIVAISGIPDISIGDTICDLANPEKIPFVNIDEPTVSMTFSVNNGPFAGQEGEFVTSRHIRDRLFKELERNVSLRVKETASPDSFEVCGRGELHLSVLIEEMRREGYELLVSRPKVIFKEIDGVKCEPIEDLVVNVPDDAIGTVIEKLGRRKAEMKNMEPAEAGHTKIEFKIPARGLIGYRTEFLTDTKGTGTMNSIFDCYEPYKGDIQARTRGVLVAFEQGTSITYGLYNAQLRGELFIGPGVEVYEGMIVGINSRNEDISINVCKEKHLTNTRASGSDDALRLVPPIQLSLEKAIEFIAEDELVEVTPKNIRLRKVILNNKDREKAARR